MRLLHGRPLAESVNARTETRIADLVERKVTPRLHIVSVGVDPAASTYQGRLRASGKKLGIDVRVDELGFAAGESALQTTLKTLSGDPLVHGILLLTPLPHPLDEARMVELIAASKDVEGVHPHNAGLLAAGRPRYVPSTAEGIVELLKFHEIKLSGARAVVVGRSGVVGRPAAALLLNEDATVTIAHSKTPNIATLTKSASIVVVGVGKPKFLTGAMVAKGATVIDAGINVTPSGITGDADVESLSPVAGALSPVPGGLGAVTTALMLRNVVSAAEAQTA